MVSQLESASRIVLVDDHPIIREGLTLQLSMHAGFEVCGEADSENEAYALVSRIKPDLVIVDISLKNGHGIELIKRIKSKHREIKTLVLSSYDDTLYAERSMRAGANGYLNKQESNERLIDAVTTVLAGKTYVGEKVTRQLLEKNLHGLRPYESGVGSLSDRELQVYEAIGSGLTTRAIADKLHLSSHTIDTHRENIKRKIGARSSTALLHAAITWRMQQE